MICEFRTLQQQNFVSLYVYYIMYMKVMMEVKLEEVAVLKVIYHLRSLKGQKGVRRLSRYFLSQKKKRKIASVCVGDYSATSKFEVKEALISDGMRYKGFNS